MAKLKKVTKALAAAGRVLTGRQMAGRGLTVFPDDVFLVSYPRSGNTWMRFLVGNLLYQETPVTFANIESRVPEIYFNPDHVLRALLRPRLLKSHEVFQPHYPRVIYIVRDPRDVAVSFYHHNVKAGNIPDGYAMEKFVPRFLKAEFDFRWGAWSDHVLSWLALREGRPEFLLLRYEDMKNTTDQELRRVATFLQQSGFPAIDVASEKLKRAMELSSADRMRELEKTQAGEWALTKNTRADKPFVRTAKAGGWKSVLPEESARQIEEAWGAVMKKVGY